MTLLINYAGSPAVEPTEEEIRERAYQLWLSEGKPEGRDFDHWMAARQALVQEALTARQAAEAAAGPDSTRPIHVTVKLRGQHPGHRVKLQAATTSRREPATAHR